MRKYAAIKQKPEAEVLSTVNVLLNALVWSIFLRKPVLEMRLITSGYS